MNNNTKKNPWLSINLSDYENHMKLASVKQLQAMNKIMKLQFEAYPVGTVMILGIAGGNGLEHINKEKINIVYGVDINADYLKAVSERYGSLDGVLKCLHINLLKEVDKPPEADLLVANLLIEYIGYEVFQKAVQQVKPKYVSCVIQINREDTEWVSDSPYLHAFNGLDEVHHQMERATLVSAMEAIGYRQIFMESESLPNGKKLLRIDFEREA